mmetsp:Transcript_34644/g.84337  ORF Transcript_34644/g.84337 Transcript_34644/m.84337 type:complete len:349 (+) Transcript_34644:662-1708(+)
MGDRLNSTMALSRAIRLRKRASLRATALYSSIDIRSSPSVSATCRNCLASSLSLLLPWSSSMAPPESHSTCTAFHTSSPLMNPSPLRSLRRNPSSSFSSIDPLARVAMARESSEKDSTPSLFWSIRPNMRSMCSSAPSGSCRNSVAYEVNWTRSTRPDGCVLYHTRHMSSSSHSSNASETVTEASRRLLVLSPIVHCSIVPLLTILNRTCTSGSFSTPSWSFDPRFPEFHADTRPFSSSVTLYQHVVPTNGFLRACMRNALSTGILRVPTKSSALPRSQSHTESLSSSSPEGLPWIGNKKESFQTGARVLRRVLVLKSLLDVLPVQCINPPLTSSSSTSNPSNHLRTQ